jgi:hypothetical protein
MESGLTAFSFAIVHQPDEVSGISETLTATEAVPTGQGPDREGGPSPRMRSLREGEWGPDPRSRSIHGLTKSRLSNESRLSISQGCGRRSTDRRSLASLAKVRQRMAPTVGIRCRPVPNGAPRSPRASASMAGVLTGTSRTCSGPSTWPRRLVDLADPDRRGRAYQLPHEHPPDSPRDRDVTFTSRIRIYGGRAYRMPLGHAPARPRGRDG